MAFEIIWSKTAAKDLELAIEYLEKEWGEVVTTNFASDFFKLIEVLQDWPEAGSMQIREKSIRGLMISRYNKLFYRIDGEKIILMKIFDMRRNPKQLKFK